MRLAIQNRLRRSRPWLGVLLAAILAAPALAQPTDLEEDVPEPPEPTASSRLTFSVAAGYQYIFNTSLDTTGDYSVSRAGLDLKLSYPISGEFQISSTFRYLFDGYNFNSAFTLDPVNGNPWSDVSTFSWDFTTRWWMTEDVALIFGPFIVVSRESGASTTDSVTGGGFAGMLWRVAPNFSFGGGLGITTQIEDDLLFYPILILDWKINDDASVTSVAGPLGLAFTGLEFRYAFGGGLDIGTGLRYEYRRFRLDGSGFAPDGVGQDTSIPWWVRVGYKFNEHVAVDAFGGFVFAGQFKVDDSNGNRLTEDDSNLAPFLAIMVRVVF